MEPVNGVNGENIPVSTAYLTDPHIKRDPRLIQEYGVEPFRKKVIKFFGYTLLILFLALLVCWPLFLGSK
jgi:hypothetical protein